jgi:hypothetical protein
MAEPTPAPAPEPDREEAAGLGASAAAATLAPEAEASSTSSAKPSPSLEAIPDDEFVGGEIPADPEGSELEPPEKTAPPSEGEARPVTGEPSAGEPDPEPDAVGMVPEADAPAPPEIDRAAEETPLDETAIAPAVAAAEAETMQATEATLSPSAEEPEILREATAPSEPPPVVESARSQEPPPGAEPLRSEPAATSSEAPGAASTVPSAEILDAYRNWGDADPNSTDVTVVVMRNRQPVRGLDPGDLELRVGGSPVPITDIGDADRAPLSLGIAVDLADENVGRWGQVSRDLRPLADRAGGELGSLFVSTAGNESAWGLDPERMEKAIVKPSNGDLAALIRSSLARFADRRGRTFLLVLTDGRTEPTRQAWRETSAVAESAGIPVLVMALWDEGFQKKMRKDLQQITSKSGGRLFMLQTLDRLDGAVERFSGVLDAGVALRFEAPPAGTSPLQIVVKAPDRTLDITAPQAIR